VNGSNISNFTKVEEFESEDWEKYHTLIDTELPEILLDKQTLQQQFTELQSSIVSTKRKIVEAEQHNKEVTAHNTKVDLVSKQLVDMNQELEIYSGKLHELSERMSILNVLTKTFSTTGLVAYKIESLVKDLEDITNKYLVDLSDGRFQIGFKISASDKLNVVITDKVKDIEICTLNQISLSVMSSQSISKEYHTCLYRYNVISKPVHSWRWIHIIAELTFPNIQNTPRRMHYYIKLSEVIII
jgi:DNA repair exonuclease SbcCD ATPase subunit